MHNIRNIFLFCILFYAGLYLILFFFPFPYGTAGGRYPEPVFLSPRIFSFAPDVLYYLRMSELLLADPVGELFSRVFAWYQANLSHYQGNILHKGEPAMASGPIYLLVLQLFSYGPNNTWPFILFYFVVGAATTAVWIWWFRKEELRNYWVYLYVLFPAIPLLTLLAAPDVLYALLFAGTFVAAARYMNTGRWVGPLIAFGVAAALVKPTGLQALAIVQLALLLRNGIQRRMSLQTATAILLLGFLIYYFPYFHYYYYAEDAVSRGEEFRPIGGFSEGYLIYFFPQSLAEVPKYLANSLYVLVLKVFYVTGLHPAPSGNLLPALVRGVPGVFFFLGFIAVWIRGSLLDKVSVALIIAPLLVGHVSWRYLLPVMPILFLHGASSLDWAFGKLRKS